jgi:hypothetical protein
MALGAQDDTMTTSRLAVFLATICVCATVQKVGVSSTSSNQQLLSLNFTNNGQQVDAAVGQRIEITLGTVGPRQYGDPQISSSVIRLDSVALWPPR